MPEIKKNRDKKTHILCQYTIRMATYRGNNCDRWIKRQEPKHERGKQKSTIEICIAITSYGCHRDNAYKRHSPRVHCYHHLVWQFTYSSASYSSTHRTTQTYTIQYTLILTLTCIDSHTATKPTMNMHIHVADASNREWDIRNHIQMDSILALHWSTFELPENNLCIECEW